MKKTTLFFIIIYLITNSLIAQGLEFGPIVNLERTSFSVPTGNIIIGGPGSASKESENTGFETNVAFGGYFMYYPDGTFSDRLGYGAELFYVKNTSTKITNLSVSTLNFLPYLNFSFFDDFPLFLGVGGGVSYVITTDNDIETLSDDDINKFGIQLKLAASYRFENIVTIEFGVHGGILDLVDDQIKTNTYYLGVKVPLNKLIIK